MSRVKGESTVTFISNSDDKGEVARTEKTDSVKSSNNFDEYLSAKVKEGLNYSRQKINTLDRGCLWLYPYQADELNQAFEKSSISNFWHFKEVSVDAQEIQTASKKEQKRVKNLPGSAIHMKRKPDKVLSFPTARSNVSLTNVSATNDSKHRKSVNANMQLLRRTRISQAQLKILPDWARRLHHVLLLLCQTEALKPFVADVPANDPKYAEICETIRPGLAPIGLWTVISKLEQNGYQCALDVFNDIYGVWLSFYRRDTPGSLLWLQTFQASRTFSQQIVNQPLKDDFTQATVQIDSSHEAKHQLSSAFEDEPEATQKKTQSATSVEELLEEFLMVQKQPLKASTKSEVTSEPTQRLLTAKSTRSKYSKTKVVYPPITDAERETFQTCLLQLEAKHHLMLFEAFRKSAVWKSIEGGEVELDDTKTSPPVFRKMISWCRSQVAVELPPEKRFKYNSSALYFLEKREPGGGKFVPTLEASQSSSAGAMSQQNNQSLYESTNAAAQQTVKRSSSVSSSSSSSSSRTVSSSDTEDERNL